MGEALLKLSLQVNELYNVLKYIRNNIDIIPGEQKTGGDARHD
jgi:hypothetical protein